MSSYIGANAQGLIANIDGGKVENITELSVSGNSTTNLVTITQTGSGNALVVEDSANPDTTPFVVNASGQVIIGATQAYTPITGRFAPIEVNATATASDAVSYTKWSNTVNSLDLNLSRSRGSIGVQTIVNSNDVISNITFRGSDGNSFLPAANISAVVDGTPGTNDMPGRLVFSTTADGASSPTERMRIDSSGKVGIGISDPSEELEIQSATPAIKLSDTDESGSYGTLSMVSSAMYLQANGASSDGTLIYRTGNAGTFTERLRINSSGALILTGSTAQKASGTTWTNPSDIRLKENITNYSKGISELNQIQVKQWEYNGKAGTVLGQIGLGVIADEIESVLPNTVDTYSAKLNEDDETETDIKKFDATEITWLLVNTCKEQQALIESQQTQIDSLQTTVTDLLARVEALEAV